MAWMSMADSSGRGWAVDHEGASRIFYSQAWSGTMKKRAVRKVENNVLYPNTVTVEINLNNIKPVVQAEAAREFEQFVSLSHEDGARAFELLVNARMNAVRDKQHVQDMQKQASRETMSNIERSVQIGKAGENVARFVRDTSATTLVIGATVISGGAGMAALGGGSLLKGTGTYQDTGKVGAATMNTLTSFTFGLVPWSIAGKVLPRSQQIALFIVGVKNDVLSNTVTSLASGEEAGQAFTEALTKGAFGAVGGLFGMVGKPFFDKLAVPVKVGVDVAISTAADQAGGALADHIGASTSSSGQPQLARSSGCLGAACATAAGVLENRQTAEKYVRDYALTAAM